MFRDRGIVKGNGLLIGRKATKRSVHSVASRGHFRFNNLLLVFLRPRLFWDRGDSRSPSIYFFFFLFSIVFIVPVFYAYISPRDSTISIFVGTILTSSEFWTIKSVFIGAKIYLTFNILKYYLRTENNSSIHIQRKRFENDEFFCNEKIKISFHL